MNTQAIISVIIPVYNVENYLRRCINSVVNQTLRNIEIICIDDGSTDGSLGILHEYATSDNRVIVIAFSQNRGASAARNAGMAIASGEYFGFVDSDDVIDPLFYEKLYAKALDSGSLLVKGALELTTVSGEITRHFCAMESPQDRLNFCGHFTTGIYQSTFIRENGINFPLGLSNGEDWGFLIKAVGLAPCVKTVDDATYYYLKRPDSADSEVWTLTQIKPIFQSLENVFMFLNAHEINEVDYATICSHYILISCSFWRHVSPENQSEAALYCAKAAFELYQACKYQQAVAQKLVAKSALLGKCLATGTITAAVNIQMQKTNPKQMMLAELRARVLTFKVKTNDPLSA